MSDKPSKPHTTSSLSATAKLGILLVSLLVADFAVVFAPSILRGTSTIRPFLSSQALRIPNRPGSIPTMCDTKYSAREQKEWNHLAEGMDRYHNHFRYEFNRVYTLADGGFHKQGMSLPRFLGEAQQLSHHLDMHHKIETYIFPILAKRMPQFKAGAREGGEHLRSHKAIHAGLDKYEAFLSSSLENNSSYDPAALREIMDGFRDVLFRHLDEEVHDLGAESMKAAGWSLTELRQFPM